MDSSRRYSGQISCSGQQSGGQENSFSPTSHQPLPQVPQSWEQFQTSSPFQVSQTLLPQV
jgi:hypothetical protein